MSAGRACNGRLHLRELPLAGRVCATLGDPGLCASTCPSEVVIVFEINGYRFRYEDATCVTRYKG